MAYELGVVPPPRQMGLFEVQSDHIAETCPQAFVQGEMRHLRAGTPVRWREAPAGLRYCIDHDAIASHAENMGTLIHHNPEDILTSPFRTPKRKASDDRTAPTAQSPRIALLPDCLIIPQRHLRIGYYQPGSSQALASSISSSSRPPIALPAIKAPKPAPSKAPQPTAAAGSIQLAAQEPAPKEQFAPTEAGKTIDLTSPGPDSSVPPPKGNAAPPKRVIKFKARLS